MTEVNLGLKAPRGTFGLRDRRVFRLFLYVHVGASVTNSQNRSMVKVTVSAAGKPSGLTRKLPITIDLAGKTPETTTIEDVKKGIAAQLPKVCTCFPFRFTNRNTHTIS